MGGGYRTRVLDTELAERLSSIGAVLIEGPKACGKTESATQKATTSYRFDVDPAARDAAGVAPDLLLDSPAPVLFDEWQIVPSLWDQVRRAVDDRAPMKGLYILTGSATPREDVNRHSGAGRIAIIQMRPMSLMESGHSTGHASLKGILAGDKVTAHDSGLTVSDIVDRMCIGGWPALIDADTHDAARWLRDYLNQIVMVDIQELGARKRDPGNIRRLVSSLARNVGTSATVTALARDVGGAEGPVARPTIDGYLDSLTRLRLTEDAPAWAPHMRSATPLQSSPTRYFVDPSLAIAALGQGPNQLQQDFNATGFFFENLVVRDVRIYAQSLGGEVHHWRDQNQNEVDVVVTLPDGRWGAFEVQMNPADSDRAAATLLSFAKKVDQSKAGPPAALGVITTTGFAYSRPDGVSVLPIGTLGP
ncbi:ATP-binding protein [Aeromicrobium sp. CF4.19]|uniref:ATP-binding protein n=1 Tax=Aeromicrobium sp. CF4.19 TaxID=3373082 RepID=UPI003EE5C9AC